MAAAYRAARLYLKDRKAKMSKSSSEQSLNDGSVFNDEIGDTSTNDGNDVAAEVNAAFVEGDEEMEGESLNGSGFGDVDAAPTPDLFEVQAPEPAMHKQGTKTWDLTVPTQFVFGKKPLNLSLNSKVGKMSGKRNADQPTKEMLIGKGGDTRKVLSLIEELEKTAVELISLSKAHVHTKIEIKKAIGKVKSISDRLKLNKDEIQALYDETLSKKKMKEVQKLPFTCSDCKKKVIDEDDRVKRLEDEIKSLIIDEEETYIEKMKTLAKSKWTDNMYLKTKLKKGFTEGTNQNMVLTVGKGGEKSNLIKILRSKYSEIEDLITVEDDDTLQFSESSTRTSKGKITRRKLYVIKPRTEEDLIRSLRSIYDMEKEGTLDFASTEGINWSTLRKEIEMVFRSSNLSEVSLVVPHNYEKGAGQIGGVKESEKTAGTLNIRPKEEGNQDRMEEIIRKLKSEVDIEETGVTIEAIRKNKNGETEIKAKEKKAGGFEKFMKKVQETIKNDALVKVTGAEKKKKTLVVRNIDTSTTQAEVLGGITALLPGNKCQEVSVSSFKPNFRQESLVCMLAVTSEVAELILRHKTVKIGWVQCPVDLLVSPVQCFKCLCHGHLGRDCRNKPEAGVIKCRKCMQDNHMARDCTNEAKCADCKGKHPAGTMACKVYRDLVNREKRGEEGWARESRNNY